MATQQPITNVGNIHDEEWYQHTINNTAQGVFPQGISSGAISNALITPYFTNADLIFRLPEHNHHNKNRLDFGSSYFLINTVGNIHSNAFGTPSIGNTAKAVGVFSIDNSFIGNHYIAGFTLNADLHFRLPEKQDINKTRLDFPQKTALIITNAGNISGNLGNTYVWQQNTLRVTGMGENIGNATLTYSNTNGYNADLIFKQPENTDNNKNRLNFGETNALIISGVGNIDANQIPQHTINNAAFGVTVSCIESLEQGKTIIYTQNNSQAYEDNPQAARVDLKFNRNLRYLQQNIALAFIPDRRIEFSGIFANEWGNTNITNKSQYINAQSLGSNGLPLPEIKTQSAVQFINTDGVDTTQLGHNQIVNELTQNIICGGFDAYQKAINDAIDNNDYFGHQIKGVNQYIKAGDNDFASVNNQAWISNLIRHIQLHDKGIESNLYGRAWISHKTRTIDLNYNTDGIEPCPLMANAHTIGTHQTITVIGKEHTEWLTRIIPERLLIYQKGWDSNSQTEELQQHSVENRNRYITPDSISGSIGTPDKVYNLSQHIIIKEENGQGGIAPLTDTDPTYHDKRHSIANINRNIGVYSIDSGKVGNNHSLRNTGKDTHPIGFNATLFGGETFISYKVRQIIVEPIAPKYQISYYNAISNTATAIRVTGFDDSFVGQPENVANTRRHLRWIKIGETPEFGTPYIDYGVRKLKPMPIAPDYFLRPEIHNYRLYINTDGIESEWGQAEVKETRNIITVSSVQHGKDNLGWQRIHNFNPEIHRVGGFNAHQFGQTTIDNYKKYIEIDGGISQSFVSRPWIGDSTRRIYPTGVDYLQSGTNHKVIQNAPPPYSKQIIHLEELPLIQQGQGIFFRSENEQIGVPNVKQNIIYHKQDTNETHFGQPELFNNAIRILSGIYTPFDIGVPFIKHNQTINLQNNGIDFPHAQVPKIRLSPNHIYAPSADMASSHYKANHPTNSIPNIIGYPSDREVAGYKFGRVEIQNQHRTIYHREPLNSYGNNMARMGEPKIYNAKHIIYSTGINANRWGLPYLPFGTQEIIMPKRDTKETAQYGVPNIGVPPESVQYLKPSAFNSVSFGADTEIQKFNREVYQKGFDSLKMGASDPKDPKYLPQSLWIGFPIPTPIDGIEFTVFGKAWVSNWIQEIKTIGDDTLQMRYDRTKFDDRMRVKRTENTPPATPKPNAQTVNTASIHGNSGICSIHNKTQIIKPYGNSETYRKGAF
ncbi:MAG: hypothetical protein IKI11_08990 [Neisseriaceae bacterium]|nr:hypothetical protein [Neisseriaceae bacterium]